MKEFFCEYLLILSEIQKTKDGYTVNFLNSSGSNVNRTFDWQAVGYGLKTA